MQSVRPGSPPMHVAETSRGGPHGARHDRDVPSKRGRPPQDLRTAARGAVPKHRLAELIASREPSPPGTKLWLADRWPWTPGTEAALSVRRPRWAVASIEMAALDRPGAHEPEAFVRELNREHDPWPVESRRPIRPRD